MSCPSCGHTMELIGYGDGVPIHHCPRCGTAVSEWFTAVPKLVERCRQFEIEGWPVNGACSKAWHRIGIAESIRPPV